MAALAAATHVLAVRSQTPMAIPSEVLGWNSASALAYPIQYGELCVEVTCRGPQRFFVACSGEEFDITCVDWTDGKASFDVNSRRRSIIWHLPNPADIFIKDGAVDFHLINSLARPKRRADAVGQGDIRSPLHGALTEVFVETGETVKRGARLAVVEAMKMQHDILADMDGTVEDMFAAAGTQVAANAPLFKLSS